MRPVVKWINAPGYKLAKFFIQELTQFISLSVTFNINNTLQVIQNVDPSSLVPNTKQASLNVRNIYTNNPTNGKLVSTK
jgi:hypothetical protein